MDVSMSMPQRKEYVMNMIGIIPHQKFYFYHLPTRGRGGVKLGDAWYVSNVSIIFDCSMLYYLLFWTLLVIIHFYIIFGTNLLTGGPAQNCCFFACFRVSQKRNIKRGPNGIKLYDDFSWTRRHLHDLERGPKESWGGHDPLGRTPGGMPLGLWAPRESSNPSSASIYSQIFPKH